MRRSRFTEEQIIGVLKEALAGAKVAKAKYGGMEVSEARRLKLLEEENRRLKSVVADLTLDNQALKAIVGKRW